MSNKWCGWLALAAGVAMLTRGGFMLMSEDAKTGELIIWGLLVALGIYCGVIGIKFLALARDR